MTTEVEQAVEQPVEVDVNDGFEAGFAEARGEEPPVSIETPPEEPADDDPPDPEPQPEPEPDPVALLNEKIASLENQFKHQSDKAFGKIGEAFRELQAMKQSRSSDIEISDEDLADAFSEYPELRKDQLKAFQLLAKKLSSAPVRQEPQPQSVEVPRVEEASVRFDERRKTALEALAYIHPDAEQVKTSSAFVEWVSKQPPEIVRQASTSLDVGFAAKMISAFKASIAKKETKQKRLEAAVTPQGVHLDGPPATTEEDDLLAGFASVMKRRL